MEYEIQVGGVHTGGGGGEPVRGTVQLNLAMPPSSEVTLPMSRSPALAGSNIEVKVMASSIGGAITNVSLYSGPLLIGNAPNVPATFVVSNAPAGTNSFHAVTMDSIGQIGTSAAARVLVAKIGITIVASLRQRSLRERKSHHGFRFFGATGRFDYQCKFLR
jgi:hypothetical protein